MKTITTISDLKKQVSKIRWILEDVVHSPNNLFGRYDQYSHCFRDKNNFEVIKSLIDWIKKYSADVRQLLDEKKSNPVMFVRTVTFCNYQNTNNSYGNFLAYLHDGSGYGHEHGKLRELFNKGSYDNREHPPIWELDWKIKLDARGVTLDLSQVRIGYNRNPIEYYWVDDSQKSKCDNNEKVKYSPLHQLIPTNILGVHFNQAIKHFKKKINTVHASYPLNIVNDLTGDTVQES